MLSKTKAIVLHHIKYGDHSIIVHTYAEKYGRISFIVNNIHGKKAKNKVSFFQPLTILDIEIDYKPKRDLQRISETRIAVPFHDINLNVTKYTVCIFIAEILYKSLQEQEANESLFQFLFNSISLFDLEQSNYSNFHLFFLLHLSAHLGFYPNFESYVKNSFFDLKDGTFSLMEPLHPLVLKAETSELLFNLSTKEIVNMSSFQISRDKKTELLDALVEYFKIHIDQISNINSYEVLKEVFN